jgi:hypothetical protein
VTFYYAGGSVGAALTAWFWARGGWPSCVGLFSAVSLLTFGLGLYSGKRAGGEQVSTDTILDTAI